MPRTLLTAADRAAFEPVPDALLKRARPQPGAHVYVTHDRGVTYDHLGLAVIPNGNMHEHMIVERNDGRLWMLVRTDALTDASLDFHGTTLT
jgi:hypothetical protein